MKVTMYIFPLISVYWAWIMPTAVGLYWVISSLTSFLQSFITNRYFSVNHMTAMAEARRTAALELAEASVRPLPAAAQKEIADKLLSGPQQQQKQEKAQKNSRQKKKKGGSGGNSNDYLGAKK